MVKPRQNPTRVISKLRKAPAYLHVFWRVEARPRHSWDPHFPSTLTNHHSPEASFSQLDPEPTAGTASAAKPRSFDAAGRELHPRARCGTSNTDTRQRRATCFTRWTRKWA